MKNFKLSELKTVRKKYWIMFGLVIILWMWYLVAVINASINEKKENEARVQAELAMQQSTNTQNLNDEQQNDSIEKEIAYELDETIFVDYPQIKKNTGIQHIRKSFDCFLYNDQCVIESVDISEELEENREYLQNKFIIVGIDDAKYGGKIISIVFKNDLKKMFLVWLFELINGDYDLRGIVDYGCTEKNMQPITELLEQEYVDKDFFWL